MTEDLLIKQLREIQYPGTIDITDQVMARISNQPMLAPVSKRRNLYRISTAVAACLALGVIINFTIAFTRQYDKMQMANSLSEVYSYHVEYGSNNSEMDMGGFEMMYE